jgi:hypothetical protein
MVAMALQADGWYLRSDIIWSKPNPMPESVTDRPTKAHEYLFLLSKGPRYFYDADAIREECADERNGASGATGVEVRGRWRATRQDGGVTSAPTVHRSATSAPCGPWRRSPIPARTSRRSRRS